ncbi:MAG TPA: membrane protein insertion efficiency factor YidD [Acidobacteriota bacterium]|nr:membrane protein insertion efficiency factor YidD [Acidobacteriota bacterium]
MAIEKTRKLVILGAIGVSFVMIFFHGWLCRAEIIAIRGYQRVGSPIMRHVATCRFTPSCSQYAVRVLETDGFYKGNAKIADRLWRCSPIGLFLE